MLRRGADREHSRATSRRALDVDGADGGVDLVLHTTPRDGAVELLTTELRQREGDVSRRSASSRRVAPRDRTWSEAGVDVVDEPEHDGRARRFADVHGEPHRSGDVRAVARLDDRHSSHLRQVARVLLARRGRRTDVVADHDEQRGARGVADGVQERVQADVEPALLHQHG